mmetsp:Transcript_39071/g.107658  ORF Transcript_39071/g.107658 Transcript_39071/m.107658 type:complete len:240 (-) Transcript_39071:406-1125(-)
MHGGGISGELPSFVGLAGVVLVVRGPATGLLRYEAATGRPDKHWALAAEVPNGKSVPACQTFARVAQRRLQVANAVEDRVPCKMRVAEDMECRTQAPHPVAKERRANRLGQCRQHEEALLRQELRLREEVGERYERLAHISRVEAGLEFPSRPIVQRVDGLGDRVVPHAEAFETAHLVIHHHPLNWRHIPALQVGLCIEALVVPRQQGAHPNGSALAFDAVWPWTSHTLRTSDDAKPVA